MINRGPLIRVAAAAAAALFVVAGSASSPRAQGIPAVDRRITYIMPQWLRFLSGLGLGGVLPNVIALKAVVRLARKLDPARRLPRT